MNRLKIPAKLVRVFSEKKEHEEFPLPRRLCLIKKQFKLVDKVRDAELDDILLHHMIRKENFYSGAKKICDMDVRIRKMIERDAIREKLGQPFGHPNDVTEEEVEEYRNMIAVAEREMLRKSDIILVTCSASGAPRMKHGCNVQQVWYQIKIYHLHNKYSLIFLISCVHYHHHHHHRNVHFFPRLIKGMDGCSPIV